jgi:hypothetical protein
MGREEGEKVPSEHSIHIRTHYFARPNLRPAHARPEDGYIWAIIAPDRARTLFKRRAVASVAMSGGSKPAPALAVIDSTLSSEGLATRHRAGMQAARTALDAVLLSGGAAAAQQQPLLPPEELDAFRRCRSALVPAAALPPSLVLGLFAFSAITSLSRRVPFVQRHLFPHRTPLALTVTLLYFNRATSATSTLQEPCYMNALCGRNEVAEAMREAYRREAGGTTQFLAKCEDVARAQPQPQGTGTTVAAGAAGAAQRARVDVASRLSAVMPFVPDPAGAASTSSPASAAAGAASGPRQTPSSSPKPSPHGGRQKDDDSEAAARLSGLDRGWGSGDEAGADGSEGEEGGSWGRGPGERGWEDEEVVAAEEEGSGSGASDRAGRNNRAAAAGAGPNHHQQTWRLDMGYGEDEPDDAGWPGAAPARRGRATAGQSRGGAGVGEAEEAGTIPTFVQRRRRREQVMAGAAEAERGGGDGGWRR